MPIASSLWYTRLAYERAALDVWRRAGDPVAAEAFDRMERKYARDYNQSYWWAPGDAAPESAPRLDTALDAAPAKRAVTRGAGW